MLKRIDGFWISIIASSFFVQRSTLDPFPPGTNVYANISLSSVNTLFASNAPDPKFAAIAFVESWTVYNPDGTQSQPQAGMGFNQNAIFIENCATITFVLFGERVAALAQIDVFTL
jgi:hypothetical protein